MVQAVLFSLILGALYSETGHTQKNIQDRIGVLFFICVNQSFGALVETPGGSEPPPKAMRMLVQQPPVTPSRARNPPPVR